MLPNDHVLAQKYDFENRVVQFMNERLDNTAYFSRFWPDIACLCKFINHFLSIKKKISIFLKIKVESHKKCLNCAY